MTGIENSILTLIDKFSQRNIAILEQMAYINSSLISESSSCQ
jgi:hypothetical protein